MLAKLAFRNCFRNLRRTLVMSVTVAVGAAGLFTFQAFNRGILVANRNHAIHGKLGHGQVYTAGYRDKTFEKPWEHWIADADQVQKTLESVPKVIGVYPRINFFALMSAGNVTIGGKGVGVNAPAEASFFNKVYMIEGKPLGDNPDGIVLGEGLAKSLMVKPGDRVTVLVNTVRGSLNGLEFVVTGLVRIGLKELDDSMFQVQIDKAKELLDTTSVEYFALGLNTHEDWNEVAKSIQGQLPKLESFSFDVIDKIWFAQTQEWLAEQFRIIRLIILAIVLLGIFNAASSAILERSREIGMLRANGESSNEIVMLFAWEGCMVATFGALMGLSIVAIANLTIFKDGILMPPAPGYTAIAPIHLLLTPSIAAQAFGLSVFAAVSATFLAAQKVARMPIAKALRST